MERIEGDRFFSAGSVRALVTVLRALLDAQPNQDSAWERLRVQYNEAMAKFDADPSLAGERNAFRQVFDMLGLCVEQDVAVAEEIRRTGRPPDSATGNPTGGDYLSDS